MYISNDDYINEYCQIMGINVMPGDDPTVTLSINEEVFRQMFKPVDILTKKEDI